MNPDFLWNLWDSRGFVSWISEILEKVAHRCTSRSWQASEVTTATAMAEDIERPEEKPRPPSGGQISLALKPELVPILVALKAQIAP